MKLETIVVAVATRIDADCAFISEYVVRRHIRSILLKRTALATLPIDPVRRDYAESDALHQCIDCAAYLFLADLVRASEISDAALARWQLHRPA